MLAYLLSLIDRIFLTLLTDPIEKALRITDVQFGLLTGFAFALLYSIVGVPIGWLADKGVARNRIIGIGILVWTAMTAISGLAQDYWQLFVARVGVGVGEAALAPAAASLIADSFPREQLSKAMAVFTLGGILGSGAAYLLGGATIDLAYRYGGAPIPLIGPLAGWRLAFIVAATPGILVAVLVFCIRESRPLTRSPQSRNHPVLLDFLREHFGAFASYICAYACFNTLFYGFFSWLPALLSRRQHLQISAVGLMIGTVLVTFGPLGALAGGASADFLISRGKDDAHMRINFVACLAIAVFAVTLPLEQHLPTAIALFCGFYFFASIVSALGLSGLQLMTPPELRARVTAIFFLVVNLLGITAGPAVVAALTQFVFRDPDSIHRSMAILGATFPLFGAVLFLFGAGAVARSMAAARCRTPREPRL